MLYSPGASKFRFILLGDAGVTTAIVVGGGIGGIISALVLRRNFDKVLLVERAPRLGGLLQTSRLQDGLAFDFGTHFAATTGIDDLDGLLFDFVDPAGWYEFDYLKAGNYFGGALNEQGAFIDVRRLPRERYLQGLEQLLLAMPGSDEPANLQQQLVDNYGAGFAEQVFAPVLHKLFGVGPEALAPNAHVLFGMKRLMLLSADASRELKRSALYDERIAFHSPTEGVNSARVFYPRSGGIGRWIDGLTDKLKAAGVEILTGRFVQGIDHANGRVSGVTLDDGRHSDCDRLVWTVPSFLLAKAAGIEAPMSPPQLRHTSLFHFIFDRPFSTDLHYLYVYDPEHSVFRVTLYPNVAGEQHDGSSGFHCTAEILSDGSEPMDVLAEHARRDLVDMGLVAAEAVCRYVEHEALPAGFPVLSSAFVAASREQAGFLSGQFDNVHLLGKSSGAAFFMNDVLREAYDTLSGVA